MADFNSMAAAMSPSATLTQGSYGLDPQLQALDMKRKLALGMMSQPRTPTHSWAEALSRVLAPIAGAVGTSHLNNTLAQWSDAAAPEIATAVNSANPVAALAASQNPVVRAYLGPAASAAITSKLDIQKLLAAQGKELGPDGSIRPIQGAPAAAETLAHSESKGQAEGALPSHVSEDLAKWGLKYTPGVGIEKMEGGGPAAIGAAQGGVAAAAAPGEAQNKFTVTHAENLAGVQPDIIQGEAAKTGATTHAGELAKVAPDVIQGAAAKEGAVEGAGANARLPAEVASSVLKEAALPRQVTPTERLITGINALPPEYQDLLHTMVQHIQNGQSMPPGAPGANVTPGAQAAPAPDQGTGKLGMNEVPAQMTPQQEESNKELAREFATTGLKTYQAANSGLASTALMNNAIDQLNQNGWSATGPLNQDVMHFAQTINDAGKRFGIADNLFDPSKIGSWELLNKEATRAGFSLASQLGSREGQQIVSASIKAVPGNANTWLGARQVSSGIEQMFQREKDLYDYKANILKNGGSIIDAESQFNKDHPVTDYTTKALANAMPDTAVNYLQQNPDTVKDFDAHAGSGVGEYILKNGRGNLIGLPQPDQTAAPAPQQPTLVPAQPPTPAGP